MVLAPIFTKVESIYPGPHVDDDGKLDERIWFHIPIELDVDEGYITYLIFPYGGTNDEIKELTIAASGSWTD